MDANSNYTDNLTERYPALFACKGSIINAFEALQSSYEQGHKLLICGNGGSASDSEHIVGELMKRFVLPRPIPNSLTDSLVRVGGDRGTDIASKLEMPLTAISLTTHEALTTAYNNDVDSSMVYAQQLLGFGRKGDALLAISTSGNSENVMNAVILAKAMGIKVIGLTGENGGKLKELADVCVCVPETEAYKIQELHLPIYHCWCMMLEESFFGG